MAEDMGTWMIRMRGGPALIANVDSAVRRAARGQRSQDLWVRLLEGVATAQWTPDGTVVAVPQPENVHAYLGRLAGELTDAGAPPVVIENVARAASSIRAWLAEMDSPAALAAELAGAQKPGSDADRLKLALACIASLHELVYEMVAAVHALQEAADPQDGHLAEGNESFRAMIDDQFAQANGHLGFEFRGRRHG